MMERNRVKRFKRVCVFCGSSSGNRTVFSDAALDLGNELVKRRMDLVYGGGSAGLMGLIAKTVFDGGCHVLGVIPTALMPIEICGKAVGDVKKVADMHERKAEMARQSDAFIALPGGYGTMEELLEMITWSQLGIHDKPVGLLNVDGYYNSLLALFDNSVVEGFIKPAARHIVVSAPTAQELILKMEVIGPDLVGDGEQHQVGCSTGSIGANLIDLKSNSYQHQVGRLCQTVTDAHALSTLNMQEYTPLHEQVAPRQSWEVERLEYEAEIDHT